MTAIPIVVVPVTIATGNAAEDNTTPTPGFDRMPRTVITSKNDDEISDIRDHATTIIAKK